MIQCVPDCDSRREDIAADICSIFSVPSESVNWDVQHLRRAHISDLAYGSDCGLSDTDWAAGVEYLSMQPQPQSTKHGKHLSCQMSQEREQANSPTNSKTFKDGSGLDALLDNVMAVDDQACSNHLSDALTYSYSSIDDDMLAYLYPLDLPLERTDCCDTFIELANHHVNARKQVTVEQILESFSLNKVPDAVVVPDAAQDSSFQSHLGGGKAQATTQQPSCQNAEPTVKAADLHQSPLDVLSNSISSSAAKSSAMLPPKCQSILSPANSALPAVDTSAMNFPYFSRPAALAKASLHTLGMCNSNHRHQRSSKSNVEVCISVGASFGESTTGVQSPIVCSEEAAQSLVCPNALSNSSIQQKNCGHSSLPSSQNTGYVDSDTVTNRTRDAGSGNQGLKQGMSSLTCSTVHENKISSCSAPEIMQAKAPSSATSSGDSGSIAKKREKIDVKDGKRKTREDKNRTELKSDVDADNDSQELKRPVRGRNLKRSRAAEVHNLSERRRRDRINEKMRALQELIPNSNKTDKASMLDEAIEYLKMLQSQIQLMSMRSGMAVPPLIVPAGLQQMQVPQLADVPTVSIGLGMGMGMHMGLGMMGMTSNGSGWHANSLPLSGLPHNSVMPSASFSDSRELLRSSRILDYHNPQQLPPMNMDLYQAYSLRQQQQQQQTQSQHLHHQIQHHPNNAH